MIMPSPRPEVIRTRYAAFLTNQAQILKIFRENCERKIKDLQKNN